MVQLSFNSEKLKIQNPACSTGQRSSGLFSIAVLKASAKSEALSCLPLTCVKRGSCEDFSQKRSLVYSVCLEDLAD